MDENYTRGQVLIGFSIILEVWMYFYCSFTPNNFSKQYTWLREFFF